MKLTSLLALAALAFANNQNILAIAAATKGTETFTIGAAVFEIDTGQGVTTGRIAVDLAADSTASTGTLTLTENAAADNTVTIGTTVYTAAVEASAVGEFTVGIDEDATIANLVAAINGTDGINSPHPLVTAAAGTTGTMVVTAIAGGTAGDAIATTDTLEGTSAFGGVVLASGADPSAADSITAIVAAIAGTYQSTGLTAIAVTGGVLVLDTTKRGGTACSETLSGSGNAWQAAATYGQTSDVDQPEVPIAFNRTCIASENTSKLMAFSLPFTPAGATVQVRTSAGVIRAWDGKMTLGANHVLLNSDASVDIATDDVVTLLAWA